VGYPSVDRLALTRLANDEHASSVITLMVDHSDHLDLIAELNRGTNSQAPIRVCLDVDAGLWLGNNQVGPKRSPLRDKPAISRLATKAVNLGLHVVGVMTYEGQVAGVPDRVPGQAPKMAVVRRLKAASIQQLAQRRAEVLQALSGISCHRGRCRIRAPGASPLRPLRLVSPASGLLLRRARRTTTQREPGDGGRWRIHCQRYGGQGPVAHPLGSSGIAVDQP